MDDRYIFSMFGCHLCGKLMNDFASVQIHLKGCNVRNEDVKCNLVSTCSLHKLHFHYITMVRKYVCIKCNLIVSHKDIGQHKTRH